MMNPNVFIFSILKNLSVLPLITEFFSATQKELKFLTKKQLFNEEKLKNQLSDAMNSSDL